MGGEVKRCVECGAEIVWVLSENGRPTPLDAVPRPHGTFRVTRVGHGLVAVPVPKEFLVEGETVYVCHYMTCAKLQARLAW